MLRLRRRFNFMEQKAEWFHERRLKARETHHDLAILDIEEDFQRVDREELGGTEMERKIAAYAYFTGRMDELYKQHRKNNTMKGTRDISINEALKMQADLHHDCFVAPFEDAQNNNAMSENIHEVDAEERYRMYLAELNRTSAVLASYCIKCTEPKIINEDGVTSICENCTHRMIMHKHMEDYKKELLKQQ